MFLHIGAALAVFGALGLLTARILKYGGESGVRRLALGLDSLLVFQVILGFSSAFPYYVPFELGWTARAGIVTAHVGLGALILAGSLLLALNIHQAPSIPELEEVR